MRESLSRFIMEEMLGELISFVTGRDAGVSLTDTDAGLIAGPDVAVSASLGVISGGLMARGSKTSAVCRMLAAFPLTIARANRCHSQAVSRGSPDTEVILAPSSRTNIFVDGPHAPAVSKDSGSKRNRCARSLYFLRFLSSASRAAAPGVLAAESTWLSANVLAHVASHARHIPLVNGKTVMPSGRLPSPRSTPVGSKREGIRADSKARLMMSFSAVCLGCLPALNLQVSA